MVGTLLFAHPTASRLPYRFHPPSHPTIFATSGSLIADGVLENRAPAGLGHAVALD